jgi:hypothetical protein
MLTKVEPAEKGIPQFRNVHISNVRATNAKKAVSAEGQANSLLENMTMSNITMTAQTAGSISYAKDWSVQGMNITAQDQEPVAVMNSTSMKF